MKNTLEDIREKLKERFYVNEEHIRFSLVGRILSELGWDIWNPKEVYTEFPVARTEDNTKVDIALFLRPNLPSVFIEIKGHTKIEQNLQLVEKQLRDYNRNNTATFTIITDGQHWRFYYSQIQGEFSDKCYRTIDLLKDEVQPLEDEFMLLLSKDKVDSGEAKNVAEKYLELSAKERAIKDSLSEVYRVMDKDPLLSKVEAIQQCVSEKGYQVSDEEILSFLKKKSNIESNQNIAAQVATLQSEMPYIPRKENNTRYMNNSPSLSKRTILRISLNGQSFQENKAIDTLIKVIELLGIERIRNNVNTGSIFPLVIRKNELRNYEEGKYVSIDGQYYVYSNNSTLSKKKFIEIIAEQLKEKIKVEVISK